MPETADHDGRYTHPSATATVTDAPTITSTPMPSLTPVPTSTITPFPTETQPAVPCNAAAFGGDVNWPYGSRVPPNYSFTKKWMLKNVGSCTWTAGYTVVFVGGVRLGDVTAVSLPVEVKPNQTVTVSVPLTAPLYGGTYTSYWMLRSDQNQTFGVGLTANQLLWDFGASYLHYRAARATARAAAETTHTTEIGVVADVETADVNAWAARALVGVARDLYRLLESGPPRLDEP